MQPNVPPPPNVPTPPRDVGKQVEPGPWKPPLWPEGVPYPDRIIPPQAHFPPIVDPKTLPPVKTPLVPPEQQ